MCFIRIPQKIKLLVTFSEVRLLLIIDQRKIFEGSSREEGLEAAMSSAAENSLHSGVFWTPPPKWETPRRDVSVIPRSEGNAKRSLYHVHHKVPPDDSPYGIAKKVQLVDKDPSRAVSLFWAAINSGDRVDSALKDMAVVMKQLNRSDEAIEAIKSFRHLCPIESQESLDNVLLGLYKRSGKVQEEIQMLQVKLKYIEEGISLSGKRTKVGRSQGRKVHITIEKEYSRLLGNLAWAYLQQKDYRSAEEHYRKALSLEPDKNKQCNLAICLMHLNKLTEAKLLLQAVRTSFENGQIDESFSRSFERATQIMAEFESDHSLNPINLKEGMHGENQKPHSSCARRNFRGPQTFHTNKLPGSGILETLAWTHQDEMLPLVEFNGASSLLQNFHESDISCSGSKKRNIKGTFCGSRRLSNGQKEADSVHIKEYNASFSLAKTPRVLFTQPQKCLQLGNKGNNRTGCYAEGSNDGCCRKLLFKQEKNCENLQFLPYHDADQYKEPESARGLTSEDKRKYTLGDPAKMNSESSLVSISIREWKREVLEIDEQREDTKDEFNLGSKTSVGFFGMRTKEFSDLDEDCRQNSTLPRVYSMGLMDVAESGNQIKKSRQQLNTNVEYLRDFSTSESMKSWADMVEEDDQKLLNEPKSLLSHEQGFPSEESVLPPKNTPNKYFDDGEAGEQFVDENRNSNMILESPCSLNQCEESLSKKIESLVLRDGYYTQPLHTGSSMNQTTRRLFCYDHNGILEEVQKSFESPLQKRSWNFERDHSASVEEDHTPTKDSESIQRKRLELF